MSFLIFRIIKNFGFSGFIFPFCVGFAFNLISVVCFNFVFIFTLGKLILGNLQFSFFFRVYYFGFLFVFLLENCFVKLPLTPRFLFFILNNILIFVYPSHCFISGKRYNTITNMKLLFQFKYQFVKKL